MKNYIVGYIEKLHAYRRNELFQLASQERYRVSGKTSFPEIQLECLPHCRISKITTLGALRLETSFFPVIAIT